MSCCSNELNIRLLLNAAAIHSIDTVTLDSVVVFATVPALSLVARTAFVHHHRHRHHHYHHALTNSIRE